MGSKAKEGVLKTKERVKFQSSVEEIYLCDPTNHSTMETANLMSWKDRNICFHVNALYIQFLFVYSKNSRR